MFSDCLKVMLTRFNIMHREKLILQKCFMILFNLSQSLEVISSV